MAKIERYESRLSVMAYMGYFDELIESVTPKISSVYEASVSLANSMKVKRLFEVILAFGNYMNSSRRGAAFGFRLESLRKLSDTRSRDRKQTLLHYLVSVIDKYYPGVSDFTEELKLTTASGISMQTLAQDVQGLRKGIDLTLFEREKQASNFVLYSFYNRAVRKVTRLAEAYKKMEDAYTNVCHLFCEEPKCTEPADFFGHFRDFVANYKKASRENAEREKRELEEEKRQSLARARTDSSMQSVLQEVAAVAASRNQDKTPATWKVHSTPPPKKRKEKKDKEKRKEKKKKKDGRQTKPGEVLMDESGMIRVAHQSDIKQSVSSTPSSASAPAHAVPLKEAAKVELRNAASASEWRHERGESMSSKAGSIADSGFSQSSTPAVASDDLSMYDLPETTRTGSPALLTNESIQQLPKGSSDGYYVAARESDDLYARVDTRRHRALGSPKSEKAPPLPDGGYAAHAMTDLQYANVDGKEQDDVLYATADD
jgi:hypothetical protein